MERRETEFKLLLEGAEGVSALRAVLPNGPQAVPTLAQTNHYFDTRDGAFAAGSCALRLRSEDGTWTITAKGPALDAGCEAALSQRAEEECLVQELEAEAILAGQVSPLALLLESSGSPPPALLARLQELSSERPLVHLGSFRNQRTRVGPVQLDGVHDPVVFEFDHTQFPGGREDWEVEVEIPGPEVQATGHALRALFERARLEWRPAPTKAARFFGR